MSGSVRSIRVLRCYLRLPPMPGGMEKHIASLSTAQRTLGVDVTNIYNTGKAEGTSVQVIPGFDLRKIKPASLRNAFFYGAVIAKLKQKAVHKDNVLHIHGDWSDFLYSKVLVRRLGIKTVAASVHGTLRKVVPRLYRGALSHCDPIFVAGKVQRDYLEKILHRNVYHLPSAPLDIFFDLPVSDVYKQYDVIAVSNMHPVKRIELIVDCAARRPELSFVLFGDGPQRDEIEARIADEGIYNIELRGRAAPYEIATALRAARVFLLTSKEEGTPTAALEAMAAGLPIVLTPSNDYSWLIQEGVNGFVTSGWGVDEIIARLDDCLASEERRQEMGEINRQLAQSHRWSVKAKLVTDLTCEALNQKKNDRSY